MRRGSLLLLILVPVMAYSQEVIPDTVMPFGACGVNLVGTDTLYSSSSLEVMHDLLGFNVFVGSGFDSAMAYTFSAAGIYPYPEGMYDDNGTKAEPQQKYCHSTYFVTQPEEESRNIRFLDRNGEVDGDYWKCSDEGIMLGNLRFKQYARNGLLYDPTEFWGQYYISMQMKRDTTPLDSATLVGIFTVINVDDSNTVFIDSIIAYDLPAGEDTLLDLENDSTGGDYYQVFYDIGQCGLGQMFKMKFQFEITGVCTVFVDSVVIHCQYGDRLVGGDYDNIISQWVDSTRYKDDIAGYLIKDSGRPGSYAPIGYVDGIIRDSTADWSYPVRGYSWLCVACGDWDPDHLSTGYRDLVDIARPEQMWAYLYPTTENTAYSGYSSGSREDYWQSSLQELITEPCDSIRATLADFDSVTWFFTPQTWYCEVESGCNPNGELRRRLTQSEIVCETFVGLCYHPSGVIYYQYDTRDSNVGQGIIGPSGEIREEMYNAIKDDINPYIKAIDSTYLALTWDTAYAVNYESAFNPPYSSWIDTIYAVSNDTLPNSDLGWFHVGQFNQGDDKYVMIVNRACSQGPDNSEPAPSISATVVFDAVKLGFGSYSFAEIIDLARGTDFSDWVGVPDTVLIRSRDGKFTYNASFDPGEGRLFKLVKVEHYLPNPVTDSVTIAAGEYVLMMDWVVDDTGILVIEPGTVIYGDRELAEESINIEVHGKIYANGSSSDSIYFLPWNEGTEPDSAGDLGAIELVENTAYVELSYFSSQFAINGIELNSNSTAYVSHCSIVNASNNGINNNSGNLNLSDSYIANNKICGLNSVYAVDSVMNTTFHLNDSYGIRIQGANPSNDESYLYGNTIAQNNGDNNSLFGIYVLNNDYVTVEKCAIRYHNQGGILLNNSKPDIIDCDLIANGDYGVYSLNYSFPTITMTVFDSSYIGLKAEAYGNANLGIHPDTSNNAFYTCGQYYVYFGNMLGFSQDTLMAENCWWNSDKPNKDMFHVDNSHLRVIDYNPYLKSDPTPKLTVPIPSEFAVKQNYPNPFNPRTTILFSLDEPGKTIVTIYNILGQRVSIPVNNYLEAGAHRVIWDGKNESGSEVASGVYFYTIQSGDNFASKKMLLLR